MMLLLVIVLFFVVVVVVVVVVVTVVVVVRLENREYGRRDPSRWPRNTLNPQKLVLTSTTHGHRSVGIVRSATEFSSAQFSSSSSGTNSVLLIDSTDGHKI
jgi:nitrate reductase gamma subunit